VVKETGTGTDFVVSSRDIDELLDKLKDKFQKIYHEN
jgi:hypothetical protein